MLVNKIHQKETDDSALNMSQTSGDRLLKQVNDAVKEW